MQVKPQEVSADKATTPRYDTIVIRGATGKTIPREVDGGEVVAWSRGHGLAAMDALEEFVSDLAGGNCNQPTHLTHGAMNAINLMRRRNALGWEADEPTRQQPADWKSAVADAVATARKVFGQSNDEAMQAIHYLEGLMLANEPAAPKVTWTPVTQRTPECVHECTSSHQMVSNTVLVTDASDLQNLGLAHMKADGEWEVYEGEHDFMTPQSITHWMPMPERPAKQVQGGAA